MQGITQTQASGGFMPVVFESVIDLFPGGVTLDPSGRDANNPLLTDFPSGIIPAGTLVGRKDATTGLSKVVKITAGTPATFDKPPLGFTLEDVKIENNTVVAVVIEGIIRIDALPYLLAKTYWADIKTVLPKMSFY